MEFLSTYGRILSLVPLLLSLAIVLHGDTLTEDKVKAAFILNFTHFIKWPARALTNVTDPFTICTETTSELEQALEETVRDKTLDGHPFVVRKLKKDSDIQSCQVAFFSGKASLKSSTGVLTVADNSSSFAASEAGVITFTIDANRVRFAINRTAAEQVGLSISSKLLSLAVRVSQ